MGDDAWKTGGRGDGALAAALERLVGGELDVRLDAGPGAEAFNRLADMLASGRGPVEPASASLFDSDSLSAMSGEGAELFAAIVSVGRFGELRRHMGGELAAEILARLCERLRRRLPGMRLGRIGRTQIEFLFPAASETRAGISLERVRQDLQRRIELDGQSFELEVVIGFARCEPGHAPMIEDAAIALARAQSSHEKIAVFSAEEKTQALARLQLLKDFHKALEGEQLFLAYQPKLRARTGEIDSVEALVRWRHPGQGVVMPDTFIGLAEETGAIADMTRWVVRRAIRDQAELARGGWRLPVHVNLSGRLVADPAFAEWLLGEVKGREPGTFGLEITETAVIDDPEKALSNLQTFADAGLPIAIDDYGSGLSSLAYLKQLPASELKIDKLFVSALTSSHRDPLLVRSTIDLAHALDMEVTAEGVDNPAAMALLRTMGCDLIQGYLIARPMELPALMELLSQGVDMEAIQPPLKPFNRAAS